MGRPEALTCTLDRGGAEAWNAVWEVPQQGEREHSPGSLRTWKQTTGTPRSCPLRAQQPRMSRVMFRKKLRVLAVTEPVQTDVSSREELGL